VTSLRTRPLVFTGEGIDPADLAHATRLMLESELAVIGRSDTTAADVAAMVAVSSFDRENSCFALEGDEPVGLLAVEDDPHEGVTNLEVYSLPWPGSAPLRAALLERGLEVARARRAGSVGPTWRARAGCYVEDTTFSSLMVDAGMAPVRRFYRMTIDSDSPLVPATMPPLPSGVEIRSGAADEQDRRTVHRIDRESFAEHWGYAEYPFDEWWEHMSAWPTFDPDDWWLLSVEGEPAAICLLSERRAQFAEGYVLVLGVLKEFRGRGLAQLLLRRAFVHYRDRGRTSTSLGVDATNTTGAVALYEKVGMRPTLVMEAYEHPLD